MTENILVPYKMTKSVITNEDNIRYVTYGITASSVNDGVELDKIVDISTDLSFVENLVKKFNDLDLSIVHFRDAVYDAICEAM